MVRRGSLAAQFLLGNTAFTSGFDICVFIFMCAHDSQRRARGECCWPVSSPWLAPRHTGKNKAFAVGNKVPLSRKESARLPHIWGGFNPSSDWIVSRSLIKSPPTPPWLLFSELVFNDELRESNIYTLCTVSCRTDGINSKLANKGHKY